MKIEIKTETKPRLFRSYPALPVDSLIADPSITIIEVGETLGFLLSEYCHDNETGSLLFENVVWCQYEVKIKESVIKWFFKEIELSLFNSGLFVVQDTDSKCYLPYPSSEPYWVIFIDKEHYSQMRKMIKEKVLSKLSEMIVDDIKKIPAFSIKDTCIVTSPNYACGSEDGLEYQLIMV